MNIDDSSHPWDKAHLVMMYDLLNMLLDSVSLEKEMATHSSVLAWRIPWMEKSGRLQSMGSHRVGHD